MENSVFIRRNENFTSKTMFSREKIQECRFTVEKMVFIRKNRNFNTKTRFSCRKQLFTSIIVLYSGKLSFYQEIRKFYVENDVFQRKILGMPFYSGEDVFWTNNIRFLSGKTEILTRKRGFLVENSSLHLKQYFKVANSVFIRRNENFTSKTMFSREKILEMPFYSGKDGFYQEKQKF